MRKRFILVAVAALGACSEKTTGPVPDVTVNIVQDSLSLQVAQTQLLTVSVTGTTQAATFSSSNTSVANVVPPGLITAIAPGTTYVHAAVGNVRDSVKIVVAPIPHSPLQLTLLGSGSVPERFTAEVAAAGVWAYTTSWSARTFNGVSTRGNALKIWNVAGNSPVLADSIVVPGVGTMSDVQISDDGSLLVVSTEVSTPNTLNGLLIYNRADPARPALITHYTSLATRPGVHTVKLTRINGRHYAFLQINPPAALVVLDITNPAAPAQLLSRAMGNPYIHDVFVRDGILFAALWHDGMTIFDVGGGGRGGSPANPIALGNVRTVNGSVHNVWWFHNPQTGEKKFAFIGEEGPASLFSASTGDLHVVDVSDMSNPREVAFYHANPATTATGQQAGAHNFDMDEASGILYAAFYNGGVRAFDVRGDLGNCTAAQKSQDGRCDLGLMNREVGRGVRPAPTSIWGVKLVGNFLYASDMPNGLHKYNISALKR